jgi:hypothetical protein
VQIRRRLENPDGEVRTREGEGDRAALAKYFSSQQLTRRLLRSGLLIGARIHAFAGQNGTGSLGDYLPVPVKPIFWGLFVALSVRVSVAVKLPVAVGLKVTLIRQLAPEFNEAPQVVLAMEYWLAFGPVILQERLMSAPDPVFETVADVVRLFPRLTFP